MSPTPWVSYPVSAMPLTLCAFFPGHDDATFFGPPGRRGTLAVCPPSGANGAGNIEGGYQGWI